LQLFVCIAKLISLIQTLKYMCAPWVGELACVSFRPNHIEGHFGSIKIKNKEEVKVLKPCLERALTKPKSMIESALLRTKIPPSRLQTVVMHGNMILKADYFVFCFTFDHFDGAVGNI
jgi:hypothetical protein